MSEKETTAYGHLADLVQSIRAGEIDGMEEPYQSFSLGIRFYLRRNTGAQDVEDRMHNVFLLTVQAIRRGDLREPERLMGFVHAVAHRQVTAHIRGLVNARKETWNRELTS